MHRAAVTLADLVHEPDRRAAHLREQVSHHVLGGDVHDRLDVLSEGRGLESPNAENTPARAGITTRGICRERATSVATSGPAAP